MKFDHYIITIFTDDVHTSFPLTRLSDALGNPTFISIITQVYIRKTSFKFNLKCSYKFVKTTVYIISIKNTVEYY